MKRLSIILFSFLIITGSTVVKKEKTYCNPLDLNYRFQSDSKNAYREAADPTVRPYKGKYLMFVSHSGGYWYSDDLSDWKFLPVKSLPIDDYAPDAITINDTTFFITSSFAPKPVYYTLDPFSDNWKVLGKSLPFPVWDPHFFVDDDGQRYLYWGCSNSDSAPIRVVRLNSSMQPDSDPVVLIKHNPGLYGWERPGENNEFERNGYNEGPWLTKFNKRYYLQYASPGTEFKGYSDGVYTSDSPLGPFRYETYSPFSYKPGGFAPGAGHSSTFVDKFGNYWHIATATISVRHMFERRLALFPAAFDKDGVLRTFTAFGDYPTILPDHKIDFGKESLFRGWMLLSYKKKVTVSSSEDRYPEKNATDEDIRTWWSAKTGNASEYLQVDLGQIMTINAIQLNFADQEADIKPENRSNYYCYRILTSDDAISWKVTIDRSNNTRDACHDYIELENAITSRYVKLENVKVPEGRFSVYDIRIFGRREGNLPRETTDLKVTRNNSDSRSALVSWRKDEKVTGYVVNYGTSPDKLYTQVMVYNADSLRLNGLNRGVRYYFSIDCFNESGITKGKQTVKAEAVDF